MASTRTGRHRSSTRRLTLHTCSLLNAEASDGLWLVLIKNLEVFLFKSAQRATLQIADHHGHQYRSTLTLILTASSGVELFVCVFSDWAAKTKVRQAKATAERCLALVLIQA